MRTYYIIILIFTFLNGYSQQLSLETSLDEEVSETSGLLFLNNTLITHNDSDNTNQLFEVDTATGAVTRTVTITNASNTDWEDLTHDDTYIYIGDFGNNNGDRTDLKVYRISISDYFNTTSVTADIINFSYSNQTDFTTNPFDTNFDAEGLIHFNDMLYVFSKNWIDGQTNIYELPKTPGTYTIPIIDTLIVDGLISGATYNVLNNSILLCGYDLDGPFLIEVSAFNSGLFSNGNLDKTTVSVPKNYSQLIEGVFPISANSYYVSAEENEPDVSSLFSYSSSTLGVSSKEDTETVSFYPNPAHTVITLSKKDCNTEIYAITGQLVKTSTESIIDISDLTSGIYLVKIKGIDSDISLTKRLLVL